MSADAKAWTDGDGWTWQGICDAAPDEVFRTVGLSELLKQIEMVENEGHIMRWEPRVYPDGTVGLRGFSC